MKKRAPYIHVPSKRLFAITRGLPGNRPSFLLETVDGGSPTQLSATVNELSNPKIWVSRDWIRDPIMVELPATLRRRRLN
jgi:hypothetical protein